jgi:hypothetical protein
MTKTMDVVPLLTRGDWAWVPGITWGADGNIIYTVDHISAQGTISPEESPVFDLTAVSVDTGTLLHMVNQAGMFSYPIASPMPTRDSVDQDFQIAYLQAIFPEQSEVSHYKLAIMDRDGSNRHILFPEDQAAGLEPQRFWGAWSPTPLPESNYYAIGVLYQGNLWIVNVENGEAVQVTGDGLTTRIIWVNLPTPTLEE